MTTIPKHRKNMEPVTEPRLQPVPKHAGDYVHESRTLERLGAAVFDIEAAFGITRLHPALLGRTI